MSGGSLVEDLGRAGGDQVGGGEADSFVFSVSANAKKREKNRSEVLVDSTRRLSLLHA